MRHDSQDDDRGFRREIPQLSELRKEARERRTGNGFHNDRGNGYGNRRHHDFDDERDYSDRRRGYRDYNRDGLRRHPSNEEPEWFSAGPTSQSDTIELRGFDDSPPDDSDVTPSSSDSRGTDGLAAGGIVFSSSERFWYIIDDLVPATELKSSAESGSDTQQAASASTSGAKQTNGAPEPPPQEVAAVQPDVARSAQDTAPVASVSSSSSSGVLLCSSYCYCDGLVTAECGDSRACGGRKSLHAFLQQQQRRRDDDECRRACDLERWEPPVVDHCSGLQLLDG